MRVAIRVDASLEIGTGHVMRCLALAERLSARGACVALICRESEGDLCSLVEHRGFSLRRLPAAARPSWQEDAAQSVAAIRSFDSRQDLVVVDHYQLDARWEREVRAYTRRILVIDDLADRPHECDVLLDQNLHDSPDTRYRRLVDTQTRIFVGPRYALLRSEFDRVKAIPRDNGLRQLLIFLGTDRGNEATKVLAGLLRLEVNAPQATLVLGPQNAHAAAIRAAARHLESLVVLDSTNEMARLVAEADLGIGTCGVAAWERCILGLPSLVVVTADNQRDDARILEARGATRNLGEASAVTAPMWSREIRALQRNPREIARMSRAAVAIMSGRRDAMAELESALTT